MHVILLLLLAQMAGLPAVPAEVSAVAPDRLPDQSEALVTDWSPQLETAVASVLNPFATPGLVSTAQLRRSDYRRSADITVPNLLGIDLDPKGEVLRVWRVMMPVCDPDQPRCEIFDVLARGIVDKGFKSPRQGGRKVATRLIINAEMEFDLGGIEVRRLRYGALDPEELPPPAIDPIPSLEAVISERLERGYSTDLPPGFVRFSDLDELPRPPGRRFDVPHRALNVAGDLLLHVTETGTVDRILALDLQPRLLWPYWQKEIATWEFTPAKTGDGPAASWVRLSLDNGEVRLTGKVRQISTIGRDLPLDPADATRR